MKRHRAILGLFAFGFTLAMLGRSAVIGQESSTVTEADATEVSPELAKQLEGLESVPIEELKGQEISLDGESVPVYTLDGKRVRGAEMMEVLMTGEFIPNPYIDAEEEIKAFVLRVATDEEKAMMQKSMEMMEESELVGTKAKAFKVKDREGNEFDSTQLGDKVIVINFWFIGCQPCVMEMPELNELVEEFEGKDVVFLACTPDDEADVEEFLKEHEFNYNIVTGSVDMLKDYGIMAFPTSLVIDKEGTIVTAMSGYSPMTKKQIANQLEKLVGDEG